MTPDKVLEASARLKDAIGRDDGEEAGMAAISELLTSIAFSLACIASKTPPHRYLDTPGAPR